MVYEGLSMVGSYFKVSPLLYGLDSYIKGDLFLSPLFKSYHLILITRVKVPKMNEYGSGTHLQCDYRRLNAVTQCGATQRNFCSAAAFAQPEVQ